MQELVKHFINGDYEDQQQLYMDIIHRHGQHREFHREFKKQMRDKNIKFYYYLITFTLKPGIKPSEYKKIERFILRQVTRPALKIREAEYVKELTKKNIPHWHISVKAAKYIAASRFNYYTKHYGFVDINKTTVNSIDESLNYINKESVSIKLL